MKLAIRRLYGQNDWDWFNSHLPVLRVEDTTGVVAMDVDTGEMVAACVMDNFTETSLQCHLLVLRQAALRQGFIQTCMDIMFNKMGRTVIYGLVPGNNTKAIRLNNHMGFTEKCRFEGAFKPDEDYIIMELRKENCAYLPQPTKTEAA